MWWRRITLEISYEPRNERKKLKLELKMINVVHIIFIILSPQTKIQDTIFVPTRVGICCASGDSDIILNSLGTFVAYDIHKPL